MKGLDCQHSASILCNGHLTPISANRSSQLKNVLIQLHKFDNKKPETVPGGAFWAGTLSSTFDGVVNFGGGGGMLLGGGGGIPLEPN